MDTKLVHSSPATEAAIPTLSTVLVCATFLFTLAIGAMAQDTSSSPHDKLARWVGHWKVHIDTRETQFGHTKAQDFDAKCAFFPNGTFMYCDYLSLQPDAHDDIALFYYSDVDKTFKYTNVAQEGDPEEDTMTVNGGVWTRPFKIQRRSGGTADAREVYTFVSPDKQLGRLEISIDQGAHWIVVNDAVGTREP